MADNKIKLYPVKLFALLAFTAIAALALIISGIVLFSSPTEMLEKVEPDYKIEYTHCENVMESYDTCGDLFQKDKNQNRCQCFMDINLPKDLRGKVFVHCVLEISDQGSKNDSTSANTYTDEIKNTSGQCDPYDTQESTGNETCKVIPDSIFNDTFILYKYNLTTGSLEPIKNDGPSFNKTVWWSLDDNDSTTGLQNKITVTMNTTKDIPAGQYSLYIYSYYRNENIGRRYLTFSTQKERVIKRYREREIEIIALALGLVLAAVSIALIVIRILGVKSVTLTVVTAIKPTANNGVSAPRPEERPLAAHVNNEQS